MSVITLFELEFGIAKSEHAEQSAAVLAEFLVAGAALVTGNTREFERVPGLVVENRAV